MPIPITIKPGQGLKCIVTFDNTGTQDHDFDIAFAVFYVEEGTPYIIMGGVTENVATRAGQVNCTAEILSFTAAPNRPGTYDLYVIVGDITPEGWVAYSEVIIAKAVTISAG
jgi:hypothetical protein